MGCPVQRWTEDGQVSLIHTGMCTGGWSLETQCGHWNARGHCWGFLGKLFKRDKLSCHAFDLLAAWVRTREVEECRVEGQQSRDGGSPLGGLRALLTTAQAPAALLEGRRPSVCAGMPRISTDNSSLQGTLSLSQLSLHGRIKSHKKGSSDSPPTSPKDTTASSV